jgi:hypothetical protein
MPHGVACGRPAQCQLLLGLLGHKVELGNVRHCSGFVSARILNFHVSHWKVP